MAAALALSATSAPAFADASLHASSYSAASSDLKISSAWVPAAESEAEGAEDISGEEYVYPDIETGDAEDDPQAGREMAGRCENENPGNDLAGAALTEVGGSGLTHDARYASMAKKYGIDVSRWDETIDWNKVKAAGVDFAFIRLGYRKSASESRDGKLHADPMAQQNLKGALAAGIEVGVYVFSQAITEDEAREEATQLMDWAKGYNVTLPFVMDYEYESVYIGGGRYTEGGRLKNANLSKDSATNIVNAFAETVLAAGKTPAVYANKDFLNGNLNASAIHPDCRIWLARWNNEADYSGRYDFWQYSASGKVRGIGTSVDLDVWYTGTAVSNAIYRIYNPNSGEHFFTGNIDEKNHLVRNGWRYEGIAWYAPFGGAPVFRLYNPNTGDHHYTRSADERDMDAQAGWRYEGVSWNTADSGTAMYRLYNPNARGAGIHHYTASETERDWLAGLGWRYEGIGFYGVN